MLFSYLFDFNFLIIYFLRSLKIGFSIFIDYFFFVVFICREGVEFGKERVGSKRSWVFINVMVGC